MIFQYARIHSNVDSKRHYQWTIVSNQFPHLFVFLTPNGNRFSETIDNNHEGSDPISTFIDRLKPDELEQYHQIIKEYPMIPFVKIQFADIENDDSLFSLILDWHIYYVRREYDLLKYDDEQREKQLKFSLFNGLANILDKSDCTTVLSDCLRHLQIDDKKQEKKKPSTLNEELREFKKRTNVFPSNCVSKRRKI